MEWRFAGFGLALFAATACGGVAQQSAGSGGESSIDDGQQSGGSQSTTAGAGGGGSGSSGASASQGGATNLEVPPAAGADGAQPGIPAGNACAVAPPSCTTLHQSQAIDLEDGTRLSYPLDTSCGQCSYKCEVCDELTCSLWAKASTGCGTFRLRAAACAGLEGKAPCLNTASEVPYYLDASGKRWNQVSLTGSESQLSGVTGFQTSELELELTIGDGVTSQTIAAHAYVCAEFTGLGVICR